MNLTRVAVLVSGGGSNLEALLNSFADPSTSKVRICSVIASRAGIGALDRAKQFDVPSTVIAPNDFPDDASFQKALVAALVNDRIDVVCLAGYLRKLGAPILTQYAGKILNVHPALLPKYGGPGMYGHFVHEAVIAAGDNESGCTVHLVDDQYDHGRILAQAKVPVLKGDSPQTLAARVLEQEHQLYPKILKEFCERL